MSHAVQLLLGRRAFGRAGRGSPASACPGCSDLRELDELDIGLIVSLLLAVPYGPEHLPPNARMVRFPIEAEEAPDEDEVPELVLTLAFAHAVRRNVAGPRSVVVHCSQGVQRTGLFLGAYRWYSMVADPGTRETWNWGQCRPNTRQNRFLDRLPGRAQGLVGEPITSEVQAELLWRRGDAMAGGSGERSWSCPWCEETALAPQTCIVPPIWCPSCGHRSRRAVYSAGGP